MANSDTAEIELWGRVYSVLRNDAALIEKIPDGSGKSRVRDINNTPTGYTMPYIALGGHQYFPLRTFGKDGQRIVFELDIWGAYQGKLEVLQVHNLIYRALPDINFDTTNFHCPGGFTPEQGILQEDNSTGVKLMHYIDSYSAIMQRL